MNDDVNDGDETDARFASLMQFGFPEAVMNDFLSEHHDAFHGEASLQSWPSYVYIWNHVLNARL